MQQRLRSIRILLAVLFFVLSVAYLTMSMETNGLAKLSLRVQVIPSAIAVSMGAVAVWLLLTFLFGRVYCSTVCPIGMIHDLIIPLRRHFKPTKKTFRYRQASPVRWQILALYGACLVLGLAIVPLWLEPWNIMRNICHSLHPSEAETMWLNLGISSSVGIFSGIFSFLLIALCALFTGRGFCTTICPVGTMMGAAAKHAVYQIGIEPDKCISCMKCEEICPSQCIKVVGRYVDNSRCVRCFDCINACPNEAVKLTASRFRPASPLLRKAKQP